MKLAPWSDRKKRMKVRQIKALRQLKAEDAADFLHPLSDDELQVLRGFCIPLCRLKL